MDTNGTYNHLEATVKVVEKTNFLQEQVRRNLNSSKIKNIGKKDDKGSRRLLERQISELKKKLESQRQIIKKLSSPGGSIANVATINQFDSLMDDEDDIQSDNAIQPSVNDSCVNSQPPKFKLTRVSTNNTVPIASSSSNTKKAIPNSNEKLPQNKRASPSTQTSIQSKRSKPSPTTSTQAEPKVTKPPPIVVANLDCKVVSGILMEIIGNDGFSFRHVGKNTTNILTKSLNDYKKVLSMLEDSDAQHHTFTPKEEQHTNVVLRHLNASYDEKDIEDGIANLSLDIAVSKVMKLPTKSNNNLWLIQLQPGSNVKQLLDQRYLLHQKVAFERKKQSGIAQCKNCQMYGHSARNCRHKYRCVKCTTDHQPGNCPRTLNPQLAAETPPSCVNCKEDHPANFHGCTYYRKVIERKQNRLQNQNQRSNVQSQVQSVFRSSMRNEGISYAAALSQSTSNSEHTQHPLDFLDIESKKHFNVEFSILHSRFKEFYPKYIELGDDKRAMALLSFTMSLSS